MSDADLVRRFFVNSENELRCGWRILVFLITCAIAVLLMSVATRALAVFFPGLPLAETAESGDGPGTSLFRIGFSSTLALAAVAAATALSARLLEHRTFLSVGFQLHSGWFRDLGLSSVIGAATFGVAALVEVAGGALSVHAKAIRSATLFWFGVSFLVFFLAAAFEEFLVRGFVFQAIAHNLGPAAAVAITSLIFGIMHLSNEHVTYFSTANTVLAGAWLGIAYLKTRSLWLATGLHYSWNLTMGFVFGLPVSGTDLFKQIGVLGSTARSPVWLSGGTYGPEGGAAATLAVLLSAILIWKSGLFRQSQEMLVAVRHGTAERESLTVTP
ncbi:MAG TPA: CPBP family intramembrane glutamic endopeptidase [Blastocatellia bacterium]|nr:CPBP family intramembrane glutamic endopeptidase [Blastocatellia bacterium]